MSNFENTITVDWLQETSERLSSLGEAFNSIHMLDDPHERNRISAMLMFTYINHLVLDLALSMAEGRDVYDAMRYTVRGERKLDPDMAEMFTKLQQDMNNPMKHN
ncbi:MAG: hypothetical protein EG825_07315 [Rhodocyclaceae bacterium]|nr:hypothetical protein [Rhodocyclaceae bacterium]